MNNWKIRAIYMGKMHVSKGAVLGGGVDMDLMFDMPMMCFLLRNGKENILVDTGIRDEYISQIAIGDVPTEGKTAYLLEALAEEGLEPKDITSVIYTHLHYDHCGNGPMFMEVPTYVQRDEYNNLMNQYDFQKARKDYFDDTREWVPKLKKLILVDGDLKLANGLELYLTKGHSLGGQSVVVPTACGRYVLTGDGPATTWNMFPWLDKMTLIDGTIIDVTPVTNVRFVPSNFMPDHFSAYDSCFKQLALAERPEPEYILGSHEPGNIYRKYWG